MVYILTSDRPQNSYEEWQSRWGAYCSYLESIKDRLPTSTYEFAIAPWHYNFADHRAPHDGWLDEITIREPASGERNEVRSLEIVVKLLAAYHDGHIELTYSDVKEYSLGGEGQTGSGHGDWLYDEIRLSDRGHVVHEIEWSRSSRWLIECSDVSSEWMPLVP
jgi:hypothetical protein